MGYRSHVLFAIENTEDVTLRLTIPSVSELLNSPDTKYEKTWSDGKAYTIYEWEYIKWYDSYQPISDLMNWMHSQDDDDESPFEFLRSGEELNDLEHMGSWNFGLNHGIWIDDAPLARKKAINTLIKYCERKWGEYVPPEMQAAIEYLRKL